MVDRDSVPQLWQVPLLGRPGVAVAPRGIVIGQTPSNRTANVVAMLLAVCFGLAVGAARGLGMVALAGAAVIVAASGVVAVLSDSRREGTRGDPLLNASVGLLALAVLLITFNGVRLAEGVAAADALLVASAATAVLHFGSSKKAIVAPGWLLLAGTGIFVAGVTSAALSDTFSPGFVPAIRFSIALTLTPILIGALTDTDDRRRLIIGAWLLSAGINASVAVSDYLGVTDVSELFLPVNDTGRINGLTTQFNHLGLICAMTIPIVIWALMSRASIAPFGRVTSAILLALLASGVFVSGSRAAFISTAAGVALVVFLAERRGRAALGAVALVVVAAVAISTVTSFSVSDQAGQPSVFDRLGGNAGTQLSNAGRVMAFENAKHAFLANPVIGEGFQSARTAHDIYLQLLQAGGLVAFVSFAVFAMSSLRLGQNLRRATRLDSSQRELAGALIASVSVWLVAGLSQNAIYDRYLYVPFGLLLGMAGASLRPARTPADGYSQADGVETAAH